MTFPKRGFFWALLILAVILASELGSFLVMSLVRGEWYGLSELHARRGQHVAESRDLPGLKTGDNVQTAFMSGESALALHPYLGFGVTPPDSTFTDADVQPLSALGFSPLAAGSFVRSVDPNRIVVGILGGSVAHNFASSGRAIDILRKRLAENPKFRGKEFLFSSTALGGYKQPQQLISLGYLLSLGAHFDIIITIDGFNEVALAPNENTPVGVASFYPRRWHLLAQGGRDPAVLRDAGRVALLLDQRATLAGFFDRRPLRWSFAVGLFWHALDHGIARRLYAARSRFMSEASADSFSERGPQRVYPTTDALYTDLAQTWAHGGLQTHLLAKANGIRSFHFLQPNQYLPGSKPLSILERTQALDPGSWAESGVTLGYPKLYESGKWLSAQGVRFSDLTHIFRDHPETLYVDTCCHFNVDGDVIMAEAIVKEILKQW